MADLIDPLSKYNNSIRKFASQPLTKSIERRRIYPGEDEFRSPSTNNIQKHREKQKNHAAGKKSSFITGLEQHNWASTSNVPKVHNHLEEKAQEERIPTITRLNVELEWDEH